MNFRRGFVAALLAFVVGNVLSTAKPETSLGRFSFDYAIVGEASSRPIQVFDDGQRTYMQFRPGAPVPALLSVGGDRLFMPAAEGPYTVIPTVPRDFVAQLGLSRTRVTHASAMSNAAQHSPDGKAVPVNRGLQVASTAPVAMGSLLPAPSPAVAAVHPAGNSWRDNSYAKPWRGDEIEWVQGVSSAHKQEDIQFVKGEHRLLPESKAQVDKLARTLQGAAHITVIGRDDSSYKEGLGAARAALLVEALVRAGIDKRLIVVRPGAEVVGAEVTRGRQVLVPSQIRWNEQVRTAAQIPTAAPTVAAVPASPPKDVRDWELRQTDVDMERMFARWARDAGWKLVWKEGPVIEINGDAQLPRREFLDAVRYVVTQARKKSFRINATAYNEDRTLVIESEK
jgi:outer membrane protein OmpA-like peptidoglycan-associated protein